MHDQNIGSIVVIQSQERPGSIRLRKLIDFRSHFPDCHEPVALRRIRRMTGPRQTNAPPSGGSVSAGMQFPILREARLPTFAQRTVVESAALHIGIDDDRGDCAHGLLFCCLRCNLYLHERRRREGQHRYESRRGIGHQRKNVGQDLRVVETVERDDSQRPDVRVIVPQQRKEIRLVPLSIFEQLRKLPDRNELLRRNLPVFTKAINEFAGSEHHNFLRESFERGPHLSTV